MKKKLTNVKCSEIAKIQNIDDNFGKTECVNQGVYSFWLLRSVKKGKTLKNWEKTAQKIGATDQPAL